MLGVLLLIVIVGRVLVLILVFREDMLGEEFVLVIDF